MALQVVRLEDQLKKKNQLNISLDMLGNHLKPDQQTTLRWFNLVSHQRCNWIFQI